MPDPLPLLPLLLIPVALLLFLNLRLSRHVSYPHDLLENERRRSAANLLLRSIRGQYDILIDAAIAVALAFALAPPAPAGGVSAVVLDCSRTMLAGVEGERPIDLALTRIVSDPRFAGARPFALVFDAARDRTTLVPLRGFVRSATARQPPNSGSGAGRTAGAVASVARALQTRFDFYAPDYAKLATLRLRGYREVTLLTDHRRMRPEGFRVEETAYASHIAAYPAAVRYDRSGGSWLVALAETGPRLPLSVLTWDDRLGAFRNLERQRYAISDTPGGRQLRFAAPGLFVISIHPPSGEVDVDLPVLLRGREIQADASGPFSERILSVFPLIEKSLRPDVVLADRGFRFPRAPRVIRSALLAADGENLLEPGRTGGALVPSSYEPGTDFALGPSSLADPDLILAYDAAIRGTDAGVVPAAPQGSTLIRVGAGYVARAGDRFFPILAEPGRYFNLPAEGTVHLPPPSRGRLPWLLLLASLAALKLALWTRLSGKRLFIKH